MVVEERYEAADIFVTEKQSNQRQPVPYESLSPAE
jgi:hypothetical protein